PVDKVLLAERLGFDPVWTAEAYGSDAITPLAYLAALTKRIRLGTGIMQLAARPPASAAMAAGTVDALAGGGRVIAGLGVSGPQIVEGWYGQPWGRPYWRIRDYVAIMRKVFERKEPVAHAGREISLPYTGPGALGVGKPLMPILHMNPRLPIWLGTGTEANVKLTAEIADGWLPLGFVPRLMPMLRPWLEEGFRRAGGTKGFADFEIQPRAEVAITDDIKGALARQKPRVALYVGGIGVAAPERPWKRSSSSASPICCAVRRGRCAPPASARCSASRTSRRGARCRASPWPTPSPRCSSARAAAAQIPSSVCARRERAPALRRLHGREDRRQGRQHLAEAVAQPGDVPVRLLGDLAASHLGDELVGGARHQQRRVDLDLERVNTPRLRPAVRGHDVPPRVAADVLVHLEAVATEDRGRRRRERRRARRAVTRAEDHLMRLHPARAAG